jgi:hypothetical protein
MVWSEAPIIDQQKLMRTSRKEVQNRASSLVNEGEH